VVLLQFVPKENEILTPLLRQTGDAVWELLTSLGVLSTSTERQQQEWTIVRKMIELLDKEQCALLEEWVDASLAIFSSGLLVETLKDIVGLLFG
jgi:hypothetical protein